MAVMVLARIAALLARRFGLPSISIQLFIGILLGPSVLNLLGVPMVLGAWGSPASGPLHGALKILAEIGLIQLMFLAGLEVDWRELKKIIKLSFSIGTWEFGLTAMSVAVLTRLFVDRWTEALAISAIVSASSFGISIYCLSEIKVLPSRAKALTPGAAISSSLLAILLMIASQAANYGATYGAFKMTVAVSWFLAKLIMFFAVGYFLTSRFLGLASKSGFQKRPRQMLVGYLLLVASLYAWAAMHFGSFAAVGVASLGGALIGISNFGLKEKVSKGLGSAWCSLPMGVLFVVLGMEANFKEVEPYALFVIVLFLVVLMAKLGGSWMATRRGFNSFNERALITIGTWTQGEIGILIAAYVFSRGLVSPPSFDAAIILVIASTVVSPLLMKMTSTEFRNEKMTKAFLKHEMISKR